MNCEHIAEFLPDYLQGRLSAEQRHNVEAHLEQCADCSEEVVIWRKLSLLPVDQPSPESRAGQLHRLDNLNQRLTQRALLPRLHGHDQVGHMQRLPRRLKY